MSLNLRGCVCKCVQKSVCVIVWETFASCTFLEGGPGHLSPRVRARAHTYRTCTHTQRLKSTGLDHASLHFSSSFSHFFITQVDCMTDTPSVWRASSWSHDVACLTRPWLNLAMDINIRSSTFIYRTCRSVRIAALENKMGNPSAIMKLLRSP